MSSASSSLSSAFAAANRGPLTTIFTPPASCLSQTTLVSYLTSISGTSSSFTTTKVFINHFSWGDGSCYPSTIATTDGSTRWNNGYYYSPGICPSGWASACDQKLDILEGATVSIQPQTTGVLCCPSQWSCAGDSTSVNAHGCFTALSKGQTLTNVWAAPAPTPNVVMSIPKQPSLINYVVPNATSANCDAIPVLWQNTDIQILALLTGTASSSPTSSTPTSQPTNTPTTISNTSASSSSLSTGAKAAIGVVIPIAFIAIVLGIFLFFRRRGQQQRRRAHELEAENSAIDPSLKPPAYTSPVEADSDHAIRELEGAAPKVELSSENNQIHELPSSPVEVVAMTPPQMYRKANSGTPHSSLVLSPMTPGAMLAHDGVSTVSSMHSSVLEGDGSHQRTQSQ